MTVWPFIGTLARIRNTRSMPILRHLRLLYQRHQMHGGKGCLPGQRWLGLERSGEFFAGRIFQVWRITTGDKKCPKSVMVEGTYGHGHPGSVMNCEGVFDRSCCTAACGSSCEITPRTLNPLSADQCGRADQRKCPGVVDLKKKNRPGPVDYQFRATVPDDEIAAALTAGN